MIPQNQYFILFAYSQNSKSRMSVKKLKIKKAVTQPLSAKKGAVPCVLYASDETSASFAHKTTTDPLTKEGQISGECNSLLDMYKTASPGQRVILKAVSEDEKIFYAAVKSKREFFRECQKLMQPHGVGKQVWLTKLLEDVSKYNKGVAEVWRWKRAISEQTNELKSMFKTLSINGEPSNDAVEMFQDAVENGCGLLRNVQGLKIELIDFKPLAGVTFSYRESNEKGNIELTQSGNNPLSGYHVVPDALPVSVHTVDVYASPVVKKKRRTDIREKVTKKKKGVTKKSRSMKKKKFKKKSGQKMTLKLLRAIKDDRSGKVVKTGWLQTEKLAPRVTLMNGLDVRWLWVKSDLCTGVKCRIQILTPPDAKIPLEILMPGSRFYVDGATVFNCANGSFMTLHLKDGTVHLDENNDDYVGEYADESASEDSADIFASETSSPSE